MWSGRKVTVKHPSLYAIWLNKKIMQKEPVRGRAQWNKARCNIPQRKTVYLRAGHTGITVITENKCGKIGKTEMMDMQLPMRLIQANSLAAEGRLEKPVLFSKDSPAGQLNSTDTSR